MYFPYLRGRQFELIALRELVEKDALSDKIIPVIEPVKLSSTLVKTIEMYGKMKKQLTIITNPQVGSFDNDWRESKNEKIKEAFSACIKANEEMVYARILCPEANEEWFVSKYSNSMASICTNVDAIPTYEKYFEKGEAKYNFVLDESSFRRRIRKNRVRLDNKFNKQDRNNDYMDIDDEAFSEEHLYYKEDGYIGFSDYSVVGKEYSDTGFAPYAVAIHIVYFDLEEKLRVKHFVSDSNDDINDTAGKFQEALTKLVEWNEEKALGTIAIKEFEDLYKREAYPGLGTVKKLSIMHHLELMGKFLDKE